MIWLWNKLRKKDLDYTPASQLHLALLAITQKMSERSWLESKVDQFKSKINDYLEEAQYWQPQNSASLRERLLKELEEPVTLEKVESWAKKHKLIAAKASPDYIQITKRASFTFIAPADWVLTFHFPRNNQLDRLDVRLLSNL